MESLTHGIVTDTELLYYRRDTTGALKPIVAPIDAKQLTTIGAFVDLANEHDLRQLWVAPGTGLSDAFSDYDDTFVTASLGAYVAFPHELSYWMIGRNQARPGRDVSIVLTEYNTGLPSEVYGLTNPYDLYGYVIYVQSVLDVPFIRDAKATGIELLRSTNNTPARRGYIRPTYSDMTLFYQHKAKAVMWSRSLTNQELSQKYLHVIDKNCAYLAASSGLLFGTGECSHIDHSFTFTKKLPGLWKVRVRSTQASCFDGHMLPAALPLDTETWQDTAMVQTAIELGYSVDILEANVFLESHTTFNTWYERLRDARNMLLHPGSSFKNGQARNAALETVKKCYRDMVGLTAYGDVENYRDRRSMNKLKWYDRPDFNNAVIGASNHLMFLNLQTLLDAGISVVGVYVDALYLVADKPLDQILPEKIVVSDQVGKFKHVGSYPLADVAHYITDDVSTMVTLLSEYRKEAKQRG